MNYRPRIMSSSLRLAVIINTDDPEPLRMMRGSYESIVGKLAPGSSIDFYNGVLDLDTYADDILGTEGRYDLVVIGGGTYIPPLDAPWFTQLQSFERRLYSEHPDQKVVGICMGHQTTAITLGGKMRYMREPELAVTKVPLTEQGEKFFGRKSSVNLHEFHQRAIDDRQPGFRPLAADNQILMSDNGCVITFQGHPEMTPELMRWLLLAESSVASGYTKEVPESERDVLLERAGLEHDGLGVWKSIVDWAKA
ncbi:class I glutamine amidotransferase-like protein [Hypoxylon sp. NC1633]|nr:class I glutamine amidotransferase-like protein [Hypoxylon sp. NC1633]